ncbi:MAG: SET domain-containing protein-lysine N-methyltransferase [Anaerolineae bacterium]|nr:SET domain-containing protein-lysine N-methyltransferase [Gemmatimonadaceae bacterium]
MPTSKSKLYRVRRSTIQGRGVFAARPIGKGTRIIEYTGEQIGPDEADRRYDDDAMERHHTFLFGIDDDISVDAAVGGNAARFINHSCDPNCEAVIEDDRIFIEAIRNIPPGTELVYDYQYERPGRFRASWKELYACHCGSPKCRGTILKPRRKRKRPTARKTTRKRPSASRTTRQRPAAHKSTRNRQVSHKGVSPR